MSGDRAAPPRPADVEALRALSRAYASAVDARDTEAFADLFTPAGELLVPDVPGELQPVVRRAGRDALSQVPEGLRRYVRTFHVVSDQWYSFNGDRATGEVRGVAHHVAPAPRRRRTRRGAGGDGRAGTDTVWFVRYLDDYERLAEGWRFARRALHLEWIEEHPVTVLPEGGGGPR